ncbi:MAG: iron chelate uptake ABC transporter family permease subunit [Planctomycetota bacterium]
MIHAGTIVDALLFRGGFNTSVVTAGTTLLGAAAGITGVFTLLRKRSLVADALSHATLPGIAIAFLIATSLGLSGRSLPVLLLGGGLSGVLGVLTIQWLRRHTRLQEDAAIGSVLGVFFGAGVVLLSVVQSRPGGNAAGIDNLIYGSTATMSPADAGLMLIMAIASVTVSIVLGKELVVSAFNEGFARTQGWPVGWIDLALMTLIVLITLAGLQAVGLIMVIALLIIPPATARFWTNRVRSMLPLSAVFGATAGYTGSAISASGADLPAGPIIVLVSGSLFVVSLLGAPRNGVIAVSIRRLRLRLRFACEHLLESSSEYERAYGAAPIPASLIDSVASARGWAFWMRPLAISALAHRGYTKPAASGAFELTDAGRARGARISRNHTLWAHYLTTHADIAPSHVDWAVDEVEHVLDAELIAQLERDLEESAQ